VSVNGAGLHHPLASLPGDFGDEVELCVVMEHGDGQFFGSRGHEKVGYLAGPLLRSARRRWTWRALATWAAEVSIRANASRAVSSSSHSSALRAE
jgi:hypothetical protein